MTIFFFAYWGVQEGLTAATVLPNLRLLAADARVRRVVLFTMERVGANAQAVEKSIDLGIEKVEHIAVVLRPFFLRPLSKWLDLRAVYKAALREGERGGKPQWMICRGAPAAVFGYWLRAKWGVSYSVESFEPHADYMVESGVWGAKALSTRVQRYYEGKAKATARLLCTVSHNYYAQLQKSEGIEEERLQMVPCVVDLQRFAPQPAEIVQAMREKIGYRAGERVGVYVGKFGSIYYDEEAFGWFRAALDFYGGAFRLLLLSPTPKSELEEKLRRVGFPLDKVYICLAAHGEVPAYLSTADFAFSPIRPAPSRRFCSPIKDGEYWAMNLPIILPEGVGDDSDLIQKSGIGGAIAAGNQPEQIAQALRSIEGQLSQAPQSRSLAEKHRNMSLQAAAYQRLLSLAAKTQMKDTDGNA